MTSAPDQVPCLECGRLLVASGIVHDDDGSYRVFQCDHCLVQTDLFGESIEVALTFAMNDQGQIFDPAAELSAE
jgi:hypothetical protein